MVATALEFKDIREGDYFFDKSKFLYLKTEQVTTCKNPRKYQEYKDKIIVNAVNMVDGSLDSFQPTEIVWGHKY